MKDFCAERAEQRGDPMLGSAFPAARLLLVERPGPWGRGGLLESAFGPLAAELERAANRAGLRVEAIRRVGRSAAPPPLRWAIVDTREGCEAITWSTYESPEALLSAVTLGHIDGASTSGPLLLVCAHSKHDPCCAMRGRPVAAALAELRPDQVFECSHLGGDRFAANVLVLPSGLLYGRVSLEAAEELVAAVEADRVVVPWLRGQVGLPGQVQAALAFGYEHLEDPRRADLRVTSFSAVQDGAATVRLDGPQGQWEVEVAVDTVPADGLTCANPRPNRYVRYRPVALRTVSR